LTKQSKVKKNIFIKGGGVIMDFLDRLIIEIDELRGKINRLVGRLEKERIRISEGIKLTDQEIQDLDLLAYQKNAMEMYAFFLRKRIELYKDEGK
jgi:hypothetical protein